MTYSWVDLVIFQYLPEFKKKLKKISLNSFFKILTHKSWSRKTVSGLEPKFSGLKILGFNRRVGNGLRNWIWYSIDEIVLAM